MYTLTISQGLHTIRLAVVMVVFALGLLQNESREKGMFGKDNFWLENGHYVHTVYTNP